MIRRKRQRGWHNLTIAPRTIERLLYNDKWYDLSFPPDRLNLTEFRQIRELEDVAVDLITEYADRFWRTRRRRWEHDRIEVVTLDQDDPNNVETYEISVDAAEDRLVEEACELAAHVREGRYDDLKTWYGHLQVGVICTRLHAYQPLLHVRTDHVVTVQPVPLDEHEKRVVEGLAGLAQRGAACLDRQGSVSDPQSDARSGRLVLRRLRLLPGLHRLVEGSPSSARAVPRPQGTEPIRPQRTPQGAIAPRDHAGRRPDTPERTGPPVARLCPVRHGRPHTSTMASDP